MDPISEFDKKAYSKALLRALTFADVKFVRYLALDVCNSPRCKAIPVNYLKTSSTVDCHVAMAKVCFGGLPSYADHMVEGTGQDAQDMVVLVPDLSTLRVLPYSPKSALLLGNLHDQSTGLLSDLCCRGLLQRVVERAADELGVGFNVGAELEFCLVDAKTNEPVDWTNYGCTKTLNQQEKFIVAVHDQLEQQDVQVEMIHAESAPGQLEMVLAYQNDPTHLADNVLLGRETIVNVARLHDMKALFLPKIGAMTAGNGLHVHFSLYDKRTGQNVFVSQQSLSRRRQSFLLGSSRDISAQGQSFMEGILQHLPALVALTLPTTNSFRRVGLGCWTGSQVTWAFEDKESPLRVVANLHTQAWEHVEYKVCDATANLYLALTGILLAGMEGIQKEMVLRPSRQDETAAQPEPLPASIEESLLSLEKDELLMRELPAAMTKGYMALRRDEAARAANMSLEDEVKEALERA